MQKNNKIKISMQRQLEGTCRPLIKHVFHNILTNVGGIYRVAGNRFILDSICHLSNWPKQSAHHSCSQYKKTFKSFGIKIVEHALFVCLLHYLSTLQLLTEVSAQAATARH